MVGTDSAKPACCELVKEVSKKTQLNGLNPLHQDHDWLDHKVIKNLPVCIKKGKDMRGWSQRVDP